MEYLLGGDVKVETMNGEFNIKLPIPTDIRSSSNCKMSINSALSNLQLNNIW